MSSNEYSQFISASSKPKTTDKGTKVFPNMTSVKTRPFSLGANHHKKSSKK